ncbi:hypothetical protein CLOM_g3312, partial [Closterium sp. NIES-68]
LPGCILYADNRKLSASSLRAAGSDSFEAHGREFPYWLATKLINRAYARRHGYRFVEMGEEDKETDRHPSWFKVRFLQRQLACCCAWAVFMDSDAYFRMANHRLSVHSWVHRLTLPVSCYVPASAWARHQSLHSHAPTSPSHGFPRPLPHAHPPPVRAPPDSAAARMQHRTTLTGSPKSTTSLSPTRRGSPAPLLHLLALAACLCARHHGREGGERGRRMGWGRGRPWGSGGEGESRAAVCVIAPRNDDEVSGMAEGRAAALFNGSMEYVNAGVTLWRRSAHCLKLLASWHEEPGQYLWRRNWEQPRLNLLLAMPQHVADVAVVPFRELTGHSGRAIRHRWLNSIMTDETRSDLVKDALLGSFLTSYMYMF